MRSERTTCARWSGLGALLFALCLTPGLAAATQAERDYAEGVVRALWYEGIPHDTAAAITPDGASRLLEMLADPAERAHHGNILECLGMSGHTGSYEALLAYLESLRERPVERPEFRGWRVVPIAMGHLARKDPRALSWLLAQLSDPSEEEWTFRRHDLLKLRLRMVIVGLGVSGLPQARDALDAYRAGLSGSAALGREVDVALSLNRQVAAYGAGSIGSQEAAR